METTGTKTKEALEALPIEALRSEARKAVGGGSWVVRATKAELTEFILRGQGPTEEERAELEGRAKGRQEVKAAISEVDGAVVKSEQDGAQKGQDAAKVAAFGQVIQDAVVKALSGIGNQGAGVTPEQAKEIAQSAARQEVQGFATESKLGILEREIGTKIQGLGISFADAREADRKFLSGRIDEIAASVNTTRKVEIKVADLPAIKSDAVHKDFPRLLTVLANGLNAFIAGPAGSGKTTAAHRAADALKLKFYEQSVCQQTSKADLVGYINPGTGSLVRTAFREAYEHGGVFLLDEIDAGNSNVILVLNSAVSNGGFTFPDKRVERNPDFRLVAAGNTYGHGADRVYVGRVQLDGATLDRFVRIPWGYDEGFELSISPNKDWTKRVQALRKAAADLKERVVISPRASLAGAKLLAAGWSRDDVEAATIWDGISADTAAKIKNAVKGA